MNKYLKIIIILFCLVPGLQAGAKELTFTVLYNNYAGVPGTIADWGFSCLVQGGEMTILFDTGAKGNILMQNARKLNVDLRSVDIIVISHNHYDHTGGLDSVLSINPQVDIYVPQSFPQDFAQRYNLPVASVHRIKDTVEICSNVITTGEMGRSIKEQSLVFLTAKGQVILTGCSHQGIIEILEKAKTMNPAPLYMFLGGMHLLQHSDAAVEQIMQKFRDLGVQKCGATHCTGNRAMELFAQSWKENFINAGPGTVITIHKE